MFLKIGTTIIKTLDLLLLFRQFPVLAFLHLLYLTRLMTAPASFLFYLLPAAKYSKLPLELQSAQQGISHTPLAAFNEDYNK
jgi:hypothetical protein